MVFKCHLFDICRDAESTEEQNNSKLKGSVCPQAEKILKVAFAIFLFILTFASGFIGRITLHILIWHINPPIESNVSTINTLGGILEPNCACISGTPCIGTSHNTAVDESWIWALFLVVIAPYCLTFMSTFSRICFKSNKELDWRVLMVVSKLEEFVYRWFFHNFVKHTNQNKKKHRKTTTIESILTLDETNCFWER